jgi:hypothetical protein
MVKILKLANEFYFPSRLAAAASATRAARFRLTAASSSARTE